MATKTKTADEATMETEKTTGPVTAKTDTGTLVKENIKVSAQERIMYVGPTVPGIGIQNCVYTEIPADAKEVIKEYPEIGNLFVRIADYPKVNRMLRDGRGYICSAFAKAREIKIKNAENANKIAGIESKERG